jgi:hypothetical protein
MKMLRPPALAVLYLDAVSVPGDSEELKVEEVLPARMEL